MVIYIRGKMKLVKKDWYTLDKIKKVDATYNVIFGERSNGKTYSTLKEGIIKWYESDKKEQLGIVRRWQEDIKGKRATNIFSGINANNEVVKITNGEYEGVTYFSGRFFLCNYDDEGKPLYNDSDVLGHTFALTDTEHNKSITYPHITTIVFDEFLTKYTYLPDEFVTFMNTVSTIVRKRTDVKIYMLGNTVNRYAPYFKEMGLNHISEMEQGTIDVYRYGESKLTVAVEYTETMETDSKKDNNFYFAFNNPKLEMITSGAWELDIYPHNPIKYKPKDILFNYFIDFEENLYHAEVVQKDTMLFTYIHEKTTELKEPDTDIIYSLDYNIGNNYNRNVYKPKNKIQEKILWFYKHDLVFYQDNEVGDSINNYLKICKG